MLNDWSHKVRAILKEYCPGNIKKLLPSLSQSGNTRFYFGHQKLCMDNNIYYCKQSLSHALALIVASITTHQMATHRVGLAQSVACPPLAR